MTDTTLERARVIVADDEESMRYFVDRALRRSGYATVAVEDGTSAIAAFDARPADVAVVDLKMPGADGLEVLAELRKRDPDVIVIVMTAFGSIDSAVEAMKRGAHDYIQKPFERDELVLLVERALQHRATVRENRDLRRLVDRRSSYAGMIGQSPAMKSVFQTIDVLRDSDATVLITGESGTGKELVARAIHSESRRADQPFVAVHCAALPGNLLESELFGHVPGAFTGATKRRHGLVERAHRGTLFLDEIAETGLAAQSKLERFLQEREIVPVGSTEPIQVDVRIVAATNRDLDEAAKSGLVRPELLFRLNVIPIRLPPLRQRREDVPALASAFLQKFRGTHRTTPEGFSVDALVALTHYDWPGNVRELQNTIERVVALAGDKQTLGVEDLPAELRPDRRDGHRPATSLQPTDYQDAMALAELAYLKDLMRRTEGNVTAAAKLAGISRGHLHRKLAGQDIDPAAYRRGGR